LKINEKFRVRPAKGHKDPMPIGKNRLIWDLTGRIGDRLIPDPKASVPDWFGSSAAVLARG
jgi:hypothetical protein